MDYNETNKLIYLYTILYNIFNINVSVYYELLKISKKHIVYFKLLYVIYHEDDGDSRAAFEVIYRSRE